MKFIGIANKLNHHSTDHFHFKGPFTQKQLWQWKCRSDSRKGFEFTTNQFKFGQHLSEWSQIFQLKLSKMNFVHSAAVDVDNWYDGAVHYLLNKAVAMDTVTLLHSFRFIVGPGGSVEFPVLKRRRRRWRDLSDAEPQIGDTGSPLRSIRPCNSRMGRRYRLSHIPVWKSQTIFNYLMKSLIRNLAITAQSERILQWRFSTLIWKMPFIIMSNPKRSMKCPRNRQEPFNQ